MTAIVNAAMPAPTRSISKMALDMVRPGHRSVLAPCALIATRATADGDPLRRAGSLIVRRSRISRRSNRVIGSGTISRIAKVLPEAGQRSREARADGPGSHPEQRPDL